MFVCLFFCLAVKAQYSRRPEHLVFFWFKFETPYAFFSPRTNSKFVPSVYRQTDFSNRTNQSAAKAPEPTGCSASASYVMSVILIRHYATLQSTCIYSSLYHVIKNKKLGKCFFFCFVFWGEIMLMLNSLTHPSINKSWWDSHSDVFSVTQLENWPCCSSNLGGHYLLSFLKSIHL